MGVWCKDNAATQSPNSFYNQVQQQSDVASEPQAQFEEETSVALAERGFGKLKIREKKDKKAKRAKEKRRAKERKDKKLAYLLPSLSFFFLPCSGLSSLLHLSTKLGLSLTLLFNLLNFSQAQAGLGTVGGGLLRNLCPRSQLGLVLRLLRSLLLSLNLLRCFVPLK